MRLFVAITLGLLWAPTAASAQQQEEVRDALAMDITVIDEAGAFVAWTPAPGALLYEVYRGPGLDQLSLVTTTSLASFFDETVPAEGDVWYVVIARSGNTALGDSIQTMRGKCVATRGMTGYSVTLAHCMPSQSPL